jgi:hypothetical membrane protein
MITAKSPPSSHRLVACGMAVAPVFYGIAGLELLVRPDFDVRKLPLSFLSLGPLGWVQDLNFIICGMLALLCAAGIARLPPAAGFRRWATLFIGLFGFGMLLAGFFHPDPAFGFPAGAPPGFPARSSFHANVHMFAFFTAFLSLMAASLVFARRYLAKRLKGRAAYCTATTLLSPALIASSGMLPSWSGVIVAAAGLALFAWLGAVSADLRSETVEHVHSLAPI